MNHLRSTSVTPPSTTERLGASAADLDKARAILRAGGVVAFPTETVYGLAADATNPEAVARIYAAKDRPRFNPLIAHVADLDAALRQGRFDEVARTLADAFWPGPLTIVVPASAECTISDLARAGLDSVALRVPAHPLARDLLAGFGRPLAGPSANRSGRVSPTTAAHALDELGGRIAAVLDGGPCAVGLESAVLDLTGPRAALLRPGGVPIEAIEAVIGPVGRLLPPTAAAATATLRSPGLLVSHYAPALPLRMSATAVSAGEALLAFGPPLPGAGAEWNLSEAGDLREAAARLFAGLRWLDAEGARRGLRGIAAMAVPGTGLGLAINDRLARATAPRP